MTLLLICSCNLGFCVSHTLPYLIRGFAGIGGETFAEISYRFPPYRLSLLWGFNEVSWASIREGRWFGWLNLISHSVIGTNIPNLSATEHITLCLNSYTVSLMWASRWIIFTCKAELTYCKIWLKTSYFIVALHVLGELYTAL